MNGSNSAVSPPPAKKTNKTNQTNKHKKQKKTNKKRCFYKHHSNTLPLANATQAQSDLRRGVGGWGEVCTAPSVCVCVQPNEAREVMCWGDI